MSENRPSLAIAHPPLYTTGGKTLGEGPFWCLVQKGGSKDPWIISLHTGDIRPDDYNLSPRTERLLNLSPSGSLNGLNVRSRFPRPRGRIFSRFSHVHDSLAQGPGNSLIELLDRLSLNADERKAHAEERQKACEQERWRRLLRMYGRLFEYDQLTDLNNPDGPPMSFETYEKLRQTAHHGFWFDLLVGALQTSTQPAVAGGVAATVLHGLASTDIPLEIRITIAGILSHLVTSSMQAIYVTVRNVGPRGIQDKARQMLREGTLSLHEFSGSQVDALAITLLSFFPIVGSLAIPSSSAPLPQTLGRDELIIRLIELSEKHPPLARIIQFFSRTREGFVDWNEKRLARKQR